MAASRSSSSSRSYRGKRRRSHSRRSARPQRWQSVSRGRSSSLSLGRDDKLRKNSRSASRSSRSSNLSSQTSSTWRKQSKHRRRMPSQSTSDESTPQKKRAAHTSRSSDNSGSESKGPAGTKGVKGAAEANRAKEARKAKAAKETNGSRDTKSEKVVKEAKESKKAKESNKSKEAKDSKEAKAQKEKSKKSPSLGKENGKPAVFDDALSGKIDSTAVDKKSSSPGKAKKNGKSLKKLDLGDLGQLQKSLDEERQRLKLFVIKAKLAWEERRSASSTTDDQDYYQAAVGEVLGPSSQFQIEERIGKGVFSSVFKCKDTTNGGPCAVKFIRSNAMMRRVSEKEVEVYRHLASKAAKEDPDGARHVITLMGPETFEHKGHLCLVFGLLKCDLRFALKKYGAGKGLQLGTIQQYGQQLFLALRALRRLKLIHGDLKPDNVLMSTDKTVVQLIDFGSAMHVSERISNTPYLQPRYYRAPEVMLGSPYDTQVDVWSLGVTLFELATAKVLYQGATNNVMVKQMLEICGAFPKSMRSTGLFVNKHFNSNGDFLCQQKIIPIKDFGSHSKPLRPLLGQLETELAEPPDGVGGDSHKAMVQSFASLISSCEKPDHSKRITPEQALQHAFFTPPVS